MIEIQLKPASTQGRHFLVYKGARDWWGNFSLMPPDTCEALARPDASSTPLSTPLPFPNLGGNPMSTTQLGKSFFQWQVEQEENKLANISQDQFLSKDADGDT